MREEVRSTTTGQRLMAWLLSFLLAAMMFAPAATAEAATYTSGTIASGDQQALSINNGMSVLTVGAGDNAKTIQLTKELVTKDGGIDATTGTVYLLWMSNTLYGYNYELQKNGNVQLFLVDSGVISFTTSGTDITGYETSNGHKNLLTLDEVKVKLGISESSSGENSSSESSSSSNDNSSGNNSSSSNDNSGNNTSSSSSSNSSSTSNTSNDNKSNSSSSSTSTSSNTNSTSGSSNTSSSSSTSNSTNTSSSSNTSNSTNTSSSNSKSSSSTTNATGTTKQLSVKNNAVTLEVTTNGKTKSYKLPTAKVGSDVVDARFDKNGTIWVRYANGRLDIWNYDLQKSQSKIKLYTVTKKSTALVVENALVTGYYVSGKSAKQPIWSKSKIKKKLGLTTTTKKTTTKKASTSSTASKRNYQMITYRVVRALQNSNGNTVDRFNLSKKGTLSYNGVKYKKVKYAAFNSKGNLIVLYKSGKLVRVKHTNMKVKKLATKISHLNYTKRGLAKYAVRNSGTRFSISNY